MKFLETIKNIMRKMGIIFAITVLFPVSIAAIYFGILASDVYISESSFIVKSADRKAATGFGSLLEGVAGVSSSNEDVYAVQDYALSRDALSSLNANGHVRQMYSRQEIGFVDRFDPFGWASTHEDFYQYYRKHLAIELDNHSNMTKIKVRAYRPDEARWINQRLIELSEGLVNQLNARAETDLISFAERNEAAAEYRARAAAAALSVYRNRNRIVDPEKQSAIQLQLVAKLQDDLIANQSQLDQIRSIASASSQIKPLEARIASLKRQIGAEVELVAGGSGSFATATPAYQRLVLNSQLADRQLASAMAATQDAREEARRKRIYLETVVRPSQPDYAAEPRRIRNILAVLIIGLMMWGVVAMLVAGVREHGY